MRPDVVRLGRLLERDFTIVAKKEARWDPRAVVGSVVIDPAWIDRSDSASARATLDGVVAIPSVPNSNALIAGDNDADRFLMGVLRAAYASAAGG